MLIAAADANQKKSDVPFDEESADPLPLKERRKWNKLFRYACGQNDPLRDQRDKRTAPVTWKTISRFWQFVRPFKYVLLIALICILGSQALAGVWPVMLGNVIDKIIMPFSQNTITASQATSHLAWLAGGLGVLLVLYLAALAAQRYLVSWISRNVVSTVRIGLHKHFQKMSVRYLEDYRVGRVISRIMGDTESMKEVLLNGALKIISCAFRLLLFGGILFWMNWELAAVSIVTIPLFVYGFSKLVKKLKPAHKEMREDNARLWAGATEVFAGARVVKAYNSEKREDKTFASNIHNMMRKGLLIQKSNIQAVVTWEGCAKFAAILVMCYGSFLILQGSTTLTIGSLAVFYILLGNLFQPIAEVVMISVQLQYSMACMERIFEVLETEPEIVEKENGEEADHITGKVEFKQVSFKYEDIPDEAEDVKPPTKENDEKPKLPTLKNVDFTIQPGQSIAFVGPSGAGKSTLLGLLNRFFDVTSGSVKIDDIDIRDYNMRSLRRRMATVLQETFIFAGTIRDNIAYGLPKATDEEIETAARMAEAWGFIQETDKGLDSMCGERGIKLSGGQKQRLAIARAFLMNPKILILDEATSSLDSEAEAEIQSALNELMKGRTTFIVAHRLSTIVNVDRIFVIDHGVIVESGNHENLLAREGRYFDLFMEQYGKTDFSERTVQAIRKWRKNKKNSKPKYAHLAKLQAEQASNNDFGKCFVDPKDRIRSSA